MDSGKELTVCHVITRLDKGGSAESTHLTVVGLDKRRYNVVLIKGLGLESAMSHLENEGVTRDLQFAEDAGIKIITLPELVREVHLLQDVMAGIKLYRLFRRLRPDIVHTHTSKAGMLGRWAAFFARSAKDYTYATRSRILGLFWEDKDQILHPCGALDHNDHGSGCGPDKRRRG